MNQTLIEMLQDLNEKDIKKMNSAITYLHSIIEKLKAVELAIAQFTKFKPIQSFINMIKCYKAEIDTLQSVEQVNQWCNNKNHGKIPAILDSLSPDDLIVLINAIYSKGKWEKTFDKKMTIKRNFMNLNKDPKKVIFMNRTDDINYLENKEIQAISLPYKKDNLEALIILPKQGVNINNYINNLTLEKYVKINKNSLK